MRWMLTAFGTMAFLFLMPWSFLAGNLVARVDLERGRTGMVDAGPPTTWGRCAATVLQGTTGVELLPVALCGISSAESHFDHGYNAAMQDAMHEAMRSGGPGDGNAGQVHRAALEARRDRMVPRQ